MSEDDAVRVRASLGQLPAYVPGKPAPAREGLVTYKVSSNENPYPPVASVQQAIVQAAAGVNRYPDATGAPLCARIAEHLGVAPENVTLGTGSSAIISQLIQVTCDAGDEVVYAWRSFEMYPIAVSIAGASSVRVPLTHEHRHDLPAMAAAVTDRTRLILLCSPNNPTGTVIHARELEDFLAAVPEEVLVVLDEAYVDFVRDEQAYDPLDVWRRHPNVVVMRTFSKAHGLAGLRVGYAVSHPAIAAALRKVAPPFGANLVAQAAALASIDAEPEILERVEALAEERARVVEALEDQGWKLPDSGANFVFFDLGADGTAFTQACAQAGLVVRQYGDDGVRVTIGETEANDRLIEVAREFGAR